MLANIIGPITQVGSIVITYPTARETFITIPTEDTRMVMLEMSISDPRTSLLSSTKLVTMRNLLKGM